MTTVTPEQPSPDQIAAELRAGTADPMDAAAVAILLGLPGRLYARPDIHTKYIHHQHSEGGHPTGTAVVTWMWLADDIDHHHVPLSSGERHMLAIACSIASGDPVQLSKVLSGLDVANAAVLTAALHHVIGGHR